MKYFNRFRSFRGAAISLSAVVVLAAAVVPAEAQEKLPAVSEFNAKVNAAGGSYDGMSVYLAEGSFTFPVTDSIGLQIDGVGGLHDGDGLGGGAAHLFWRDPSVGLFGLYGSGFASTAETNYSVANVGVEGAFYFGMFTIEGLVGAQFVNRLDTDIFGTALLAVYPVDDLRIHAGYRYWFGESIGVAGFEWQLPGQNDNSINFGLFADGQVRENLVAGWAGFRVYFGSQKPLIRRHREDDPSLGLPADITTFPVAPAGGGTTTGEPPVCERRVKQVVTADVATNNIVSDIPSKQECSEYYRYMKTMEATALN